METTGTRFRSTAEPRRATVLRRAITVFAHAGYRATDPWVGTLTAGIRHPGSAADTVRRGAASA